MAACREALVTRSAQIILRENVMEMIETVLENNTFNLGNQHYKQTAEITIDTRSGRNFACSYMRKWDEELLEYRHQPMFYKRYIDNGCGINSAKVLIGHLEISVFQQTNQY